MAWQRSPTTGNSGALCWPAEILGIDGRERTANHYDELPEIARAKNILFLGFFFHRSLVEKAGLPEAGFFLSGDDTEYCARLNKLGAEILLVKASRIRHPMLCRKLLSVFGMQVSVLELAPWKRYYDVRNRLLIVRTHYGVRLWTEALPGTLLRWVVTLVSQEGRWHQSRAFALGIWHGLRGTMGIRWRPGA